MYTLITALGTGMYKEGYRKTSYKFEELEPIETSLFFKAILQSNKYNIGKAVIIGTHTSGWDMLAEDLGDDEFWLELKEKCEKTGVTNELLYDLEKRLSNYYNIKIHLIAHTSTIENNTVEELFKSYTKAIDFVKENENILLDITHGFRTMPIFMYQSLLFKFSHRADVKINIIYGEYIASEKLSYVRDISKYWELSQITEAKNRFFMQLDGKLLAEKLKSTWEAGSKCIQAFSDIVSSNFALQIPEILNQIKNLEKKTETLPFWAEDIQIFLQNFEKRIRSNFLYDMLYNYSHFLAEKNLYTQAVIALQISIEVKIITCVSKNSQDIGDYDKWQGNLNGNTGYRAKYYDLRKNFPKKERLIKLESLRNQIAHGGSKSKKMKGEPQAVNTKNTFDSAQKHVKDFFAFIEQNYKLEQK
ncbi:MAG: TIGR02221 family CRISPR-associated protein [Treponemataceae bacterium]